MMLRLVSIAVVCCIEVGVGSSADYPLLARPQHEASSASPVDFDREPLWAYGFATPARPEDRAEPQPPPSRNLRPGEDPVEQTRSHRLEGSDATYSLIDVRDLHNVIDWFPGDHPVMPNIVSHGPARLGDLGRGCGSCHLPNGKGRPENASIAGLPPAYFIRQLEDFRSGRRRSADPRKPNTNTMIDLARALTDEETQAAAAYFASMKPTPWIRVVEADVVPSTRIIDNLFLPMAGGGTEPIGARIIEMPEDEEQSERYRNPRSGFVAYVPRGSVSEGRDLVTSGTTKIGGRSAAPPRTVPCGTCHGADLSGAGDVPSIAGRSPSYVVRQLWDMQQATRRGAYTQVMKPALEHLTADDMRSIAAYLASRVPNSPPR